ncbi:MAG: ribonuclease Z [Desulfobacterales bacterium]|nr:ribonuclease Z [Desulfobacterales bacterium]
MRPSFYPRLINSPFGDPGLFISFLFENRGMIFDLGDNHALSPRDLLKTRHVFVSHTHMDHFMGFDRLLRLFLGREKNLYLYGPEGFIKNVAGKLAGYSWNLVAHYPNPFVLHVTEIHPRHLATQHYAVHDQFRPAREAMVTKFDGELLHEPALTVSAMHLDHRIPCLGFYVKERFHVNIMKDAVLGLGLEIGPWLKEFKQALFSPTHPESVFEVRPKTRGGKTKQFTVKDLSSRIARITPGQKITYLADLAYDRSMLSQVVEFAKESDQLFIEAAFLEKHRDIAEKKSHLTAWQAGQIAGMARVKQFTIFHFSPRYAGQEHLLVQEAQAAYCVAFPREDSF